MFDGLFYPGAGTYGRFSGPTLKILVVDITYSQEGQLFPRQKGGTS